MVSEDVKLVFASTGDWVGIYVDDELIEQGHSLEPEQVLNAIGLDNHDQVGIDFDQAGWRRLPQHYSEVAKVLAKQAPEV